MLSMKKKQDFPWRGSYLHNLDGCSGGSVNCHNLFFVISFRNTAYPVDTSIVELFVELFVSLLEQILYKINI